MEEGVGPRKSSGPASIRWLRWGWEGAFDVDEEDCEGRCCCRCCCRCSLSDTPESDPPTEQEEEEEVEVVEEEDAVESAERKSRSIDRRLCICGGSIPHVHVL